MCVKFHHRKLKGHLSDFAYLYCGESSSIASTLCENPFFSCANLSLVTSSPPRLSSICSHTLASVD